MTPPWLAAYSASWAGLGAFLFVLHYAKYRGLPVTHWTPGAAWTRAFIYFAFANLVSIATGTFEALCAQPLFTAQQLGDVSWRAYAAVCGVYLFFAYWVLWARMTVTFERRFHLPSQLFFGLVWGASTGQMLLSFYHVTGLLSLPGWAHYVLAYACMGAFQYSVQDYFWDVYVSPEHDTPRSIVIKTMVCHIPNVALCLGFLVLYDNYLIYVLFQTFALLAATVFQRLPPPWAKGAFRAPMTQPGLFGMPRGLGYREELDPHSARFRLAPIGTATEPAA